jgi:hypothetical protein
MYLMQLTMQGVVDQVEVEGLAPVVEGRLWWWGLLGRRLLNLNDQSFEREEHEK